MSSITGQITLVWHVVERARKRCPLALALLPVVGQESDPLFYQLQSWGKVGPTRHLGSTAKLALLTSVEVNQHRECECGRSGPSPLLCG